MPHVLFMKHNAPFATIQAKAVKYLTDHPELDRVNYRHGTAGICQLFAFNRDYLTAKGLL